MVGSLVGVLGSVTPGGSTGIPLPPGGSSSGGSSGSTEEPTKVG